MSSGTFHSDPADEPVIGLTIGVPAAPPAADDGEYVIGAVSPPRRELLDEDEFVIGAAPPASGLAAPGRPAPPPAPIPISSRMPEPAVDEEIVDDGGPYYAEPEPRFAGPVYDDGRGAGFWVFLGLAVVVGAVALYALYRAISGLGGDDDTVEPINETLVVRIETPRNGDSLPPGEVAFALVAESATAVDRFELVLDGASAAEALPVAAGEGRWTAVVKLTLPAGQHQVIGRAIAGAFTKASAPVSFTVTGVATPTPVSVVGRAIATATLRLGPGDTFEPDGTLQAGTDVKILGRSADSEWLVLETEKGERWVRRDAIQEQGNIAAIPVRTPAGTPPSGTPTPTPTQGTPTPTVASGPDLSPTDARLVFAGAGSLVLRVTVKNDGADYSGPVVIGLVTAPGGIADTQVVFDLSIKQGAAATADFEVRSPPARIDATVTIDPGGAIRETNKENNRATFGGIAAPAEPPDLGIAGVSVDTAPTGSIVVSIRNDGGALPSSEIRVRVVVAGQEVSQSKTTAVARGETVQFTFPKFATGTGTVELFVGTTKIGQVAVEVAAPTGPTPTRTAGAAPTATPAP